MLSHVSDVLVLFDSWDKHLVHVQQVLDSPKDAALAASPSKCVFSARSLGYLGHLVGVGYVSVPESRVRAIKEYRKPVTRKNHWAYLGMVRYYRWFIPGFAGRAGSLFAALKRIHLIGCVGLKIFPMHTTSCLMLFVSLQFSLYLGPQTTSFSTRCIVWST